MILIIRKKRKRGCEERRFLCSGFIMSEIKTTAPPTHTKKKSKNNLTQFGMHDSRK